MAKKKKPKKAKAKTSKEVIEEIVKNEGMCEVLNVLRDYASGQGDLADEEKYAAEEKKGNWDDVLTSIEEAQSNLGYVHDC